MMNKIILTMSTGLVMLSLAACSTGTPNQMVQRYLYKESVTERHTPKTTRTEPKQPIAIYQKQETPNKPYRILGEASVDRTNLFGMMRKAPAIEDALKKLASSIGGDAIMNIHSEPNQVRADVIVFEKLIF